MGVIQDIKSIGNESHPNKYQEIIDGLKNGTFKNICFIQKCLYQKKNPLHHQH